MALRNGLQLLLQESRAALQLVALGQRQWPRRPERKLQLRHAAEVAPQLHDLSGDQVNFGS